MGTDRFSRHVPGSTEPMKKWRLVADADFSRNVNFQMIEDPSGEPRWIGRYLTDLLEVVAETHPQGLLVDIEGVEYILTVAPAPKGAPNG